MKVVHYYRCSGDKQDTSIELQEKDCLKDDPRKGHEVLATFIDEGKSGSKDQEKRVEFWKALQYLKDHPEVEGFKVLNTSRFGRVDNIESAKPKSMLRETGCLLITVEDGNYDFNNDQDRLISGIKDELNNSYSVKIGRDSLKGKLDKIKAGIATAAGGPPPYGLIKIATDPRGNEHIITRHEGFSVPKDWADPVFALGDETEVDVVRWLFTEFLKREVSYVGLARELNEQGISSPTGGKWCNVTVRAMLVNPSYAGASYIGKRASGKFYRSGPDEVVKADWKAKGEQFRDLAEMPIKWDAFTGPITTEQWLEAWGKVQKRAAAGTKTKSKGNQRSYLLKSVLHCGHCGKAMQGKYISKLKPDNRTQYRCTSRPTNCPECNGSAKEHEVLPVVLAVVERALGSLKSLKSKPRGKGPKQDGQKALKGLLRQIEQVERRQDMTTSDETWARLDDQLTELRAERDALKSKLGEAPKAPSRVTEWYDWVRANREQLVDLPDPNATYEVPVRANVVKSLIDAGKGESISRRPKTVKASIPEFQSKLSEMGIKVRCYFRDTGKRQGRWLLDKGRLTIEANGEVADIAAECAGR